MSRLLIPVSLLQIADHKSLWHPRIHSDDTCPAILNYAAIPRRHLGHTKQTSFTYSSGGRCIKESLAVTLRAFTHTACHFAETASKRDATD